MTIDALVRSLSAPPDGVAWAWALERAAEAPLSVRVLTATSDAPQRPPRADELWLWFGSPATASAADFSGHLSADEQARAQRFLHGADRWTCAAARAVLRQLLSRMLGASPLDLRFPLGSNGKPQLAETEVAFNLSHKRGLVAIAFSGSTVGIDVEHLHALPDLMDVARTAFAPEMQAHLEACPDEAARASLFFRFWTLGEAFIKATGEGVSQGLDSFTFSPAGAPALTRVNEPWGPSSRWRFYCAP